MPRLLAAATDAEGFAALDVPLTAWAALIAAIGALLAIDLYLHRGDREPTPRRALVESLAWVAFGLGFGAVLVFTLGGAATGEYYAGYLIEKSLSMDNVFIWAVLFAAFAIPLRYQHRVLFWGVFGALVLRAVFIFAGVPLLERFWWLLVGFGAFVVWSGIRVMRHRADEGTGGHDRAVRALSRFVPVAPDLDGHRFFTRVDGRLAATPLLGALVAIEATDIVFAVESVPAILAVSREPFLVFAANAFAILGLRAAYFLLAGWKERLHYLAHGLGAILIFVGTKMAVSHWWHMPTGASLAVIVALLVIAVVASRRHERQAREWAAEPAGERVSA